MGDLLGEDALAGGPGVDAGVGHPDGPRRVPDRHLHVRSAALDVVALKGGSVNELNQASKHWLREARIPYLIIFSKESRIVSVTVCFLSIRKSGFRYVLFG